MIKFKLFTKYNFNRKDRRLQIFGKPTLDCSAVSFYQIQLVYLHRGEESFECASFAPGVKEVNTNLFFERL